MGCLNIDHLFLIACLLPLLPETWKRSASKYGTSRTRRPRWSSRASRLGSSRASRLGTFARRTGWLGTWARRTVWFLLSACFLLLLPLLLRLATRVLWPSLWWPSRPSRPSWTTTFLKW